MAAPALLTVPGNSAAVEIDGRLNDAAWKKAPGAILVPNCPEDGRQFEDGRFQVTCDHLNLW